MAQWVKIRNGFNGCEIIGIQSPADSYGLMGVRTAHQTSPALVGVFGEGYVGGRDWTPHTHWKRKIKYKPTPQEMVILKENWKGPFPKILGIQELTDEELWGINND